MSGDEVEVQGAEGERPGFGPPRYPGDTRPPFAPGNELAVTHGAYSSRRWEPLADELVARLLAEARREGSPSAYLLEPAFEGSLLAWARAEAQVHLLSTWLADRDGMGLDADGEVIGAAKMLLRYEATAERARDRLGLSPLARARPRARIGKLPVLYFRPAARRACSVSPTPAPSGQV